VSKRREALSARRAALSARREAVSVRRVPASGPQQPSPQEQEQWQPPLYVPATATPIRDLNQAAAALRAEAARARAQLVR
jgi:hypothetical protein